MNCSQPCSIGNPGSRKADDGGDGDGCGYGDGVGGGGTRKNSLLCFLTARNFDEKSKSC